MSKKLLKDASRPQNKDEKQALVDQVLYTRKCFHHKKAEFTPCAIFAREEAWLEESRQINW